VQWEKSSGKDSHYQSHYSTFKFRHRMQEDEIRALISDLESDRIERTVSFREDKLGPAVCALSNDFPNNKQSGYILLGIKDDGTVAGISIGDEELKKIGGVKTNGNVLPQPSIVVSEVFHIDGGDVVAVEVKSCFRFELSHQI